MKLISIIIITVLLCSCSSTTSDDKRVPSGNAQYLQNIIRAKYSQEDDAADSSIATGRVKLSRTRVSDEYLNEYQNFQQVDESDANSEDLDYKPQSSSEGVEPVYKFRDRSAKVRYFVENASPKERYKSAVVQQNKALLKNDMSEYHGVAKEEKVVHVAPNKKKSIVPVAATTEPQQAQPTQPTQPTPNQVQGSSNADTKLVVKQLKPSANPSFGAQSFPGQQVPTVAPTQMPQVAQQNTMSNTPSAPSSPSTPNVPGTSITPPQAGQQPATVTPPSTPQQPMVTNPLQPPVVVPTPQSIQPPVVVPTPQSIQPPVVVPTPQPTQSQTSQNAPLAAPTPDIAPLNGQQKYDLSNRPVPLP